jgi:RNA polymerase sigma factor (sigma-70 family)
MNRHKSIPAGSKGEKAVEMENVFGAGYAGDMDDAALVDRAKQGEKAALEALVKKHQEWIYNIALRMVGNPEDAEDIAQEILIKLITKLSTFRKRSSFRTWLYRIVVNHALTMRRRPWERMFRSFDRQARLIDTLQASDSVEEELLVHETRTGCISGMLLCLDRSQRLALILGTFFGASSTLGGELMETTPEGFRQILSRARKQLGNFMNDTCGLMNENNPCRCPRKVQSAIRAGFVDPANLRFNGRYLRRIEEFVTEKADSIDAAFETKLHGILRREPLYAAPNYRRMIGVMLRRGDLGKIINFR